MNPWPDLSTCRLFLNGLIGTQLTEDDLFQLGSVQLSPLRSWLIQHGLGPLTYHRYAKIWPELSNYVKADAISAVAENALHFQSLKATMAALDSADLKPVVLKGAALAEAAYGDPGLRPMSDVDLFMLGDDVEKAALALGKIGYRIQQNKKRPLKLQQLAEGEIELVIPDDTYGTIDMHWSPFPGWWYKRTATVNTKRLWDDRASITVAGYDMYRLSAEDTIIHLCTHLSANAHFGPHTSIRTLIDIVLAIRAWPPDWDRLVQRTREWRLTTAVWVVLDYVDRFIGIPALKPVVSQLAPSPARINLLRRFTSVDHIFAGKNLSIERARFLYLFALTDRPRDAFTYVARSFWPEKKWLTARYGQPVTHFHHLRHLLRQS